MVELDVATDLRRLGDWLTGAGLRLQRVKPAAGEPLPADPTEYAGMVVFGRQHPDAPPWPAGAESLLRKAVRYRVPTLAIGRGAQLLALAHGGAVAPASSAQAGAALAARRDAADSDVLFERVPFTPDVVQWLRDEISELPAGAVLLAASVHHPHQAFRIGSAAWGLQFHIEPDPGQLAEWAVADPELLLAAGVDPDVLVAGVAAVGDDLAEVWQPVAARFAAVVRGELVTAPPDLPLLGQ